jgi:DNA-binding NarL/FixJ family response regulator
MTRVFLADAKFDIRLALRLLLVDMQMLVVGEAVDWPSALAQVPTMNPDMLVLDWELPAATYAGAALAVLLTACPNLRVAVLSRQLDARQAALSAGADAFITIGDAPDRVTERLLAAAGDSRS